MAFANGMTFLGGEGNDTYHGSTFDVVFEGDADIDTINTGSGTESLFGGSDNDIFFVNNPGGDYLDGGAGINDVIYYYQANASLYWKFHFESIGDSEFGYAKAYSDAARTILVSNDTLYQFEDFNGTNGNDIIEGNQANNYLAGGDGNDSISGGDGNDAILPGLADNGGSNTVSGGAGYDILSFEGISAAYSLNVYSSIDMYGPSYFANTSGSTDGFEEIIGGEGNDHFYGFLNNIVLRGGLGNDGYDGEVLNSVTF